MSVGINRYKADLREMQFVLFEQFGFNSIAGQAPFEAWGADEARAVLTETYRFCREVLGPTNSQGDREGCTFKDGKVTAPRGFKDAWDKLYESGFKTIAAPVDHGGQGAPYMLFVLVEEMLSGANTAFNMYPGLAYGAAEVIMEFGTSEQKKRYAQLMLNGKFGGTMCLTEPHAGTDVGSAKTTAKRRPDGTFLIRGTKIFISGGDHDLAPNIVHLVLARIDGAPAGTKGLSLFVVPKTRVNADGTLGKGNDVSVGSIEHKMGINGSATCVLNFGENDDCIGELVGTVENTGMAQMFKMMNGARIAVGVQGLGVMSSAYLNALEYAKDRKQGASIKNWKDPSAPRVPIIEHGDVRRLLLDGKAHSEGVRALVMKLAYHSDQSNKLRGKDDDGANYHHGQVELLTPLVKSYSSDSAFRVAENMIQVYGGAGYLKDWPVEQYCRDAKIFSIYEGTNHIQAMDLVGRKMGMSGGAYFQQFMGDVSGFVDKNKEHKSLGSSVKQLAAAQEAIISTAMTLLGWAQSGKLNLVPTIANRFLNMMSELAIGWLLLDAAIIADEALGKVSATDPDKSFYEGKKFSAVYYAKNILPNVEHAAKIVASEDTTVLDMPLEAFATT